MRKTEPRTKFMRIRCDKCKNEQVLFSNAATLVKCLVCEEVLAEPRAGKAVVKAQMLEVLS